MWPLLNILLANLPVLLLLTVVWIPTSGINQAYDNTKPGKYYTGDSLNSMLYNITQNEKHVVDLMWVNGTAEAEFRTWFKQLKLSNASTVICGFRWEYKGSELGGYCYDGQVKTSYATPQIRSFLRSTRGSSPIRERVVLSAGQNSGSKFRGLSWTINRLGKTYSAYPIQEFGAVESKSDLLNFVECQVGRTVVTDGVGGWALFDKATTLEDAKAKHSSKRFQILSGTSFHDYGSLFKSNSSYTSVASYCDMVDKKFNKKVVGWGGTYYSSNSKSLGFILAYWPLLLMYMTSMTITGDAYGKDMLKGYNAFLRTGAAINTSLQIFAFNERLYYILYNFWGSSDFDTFVKYYNIEMWLMMLAFVLFQSFVVATEAKAAIGKHYCKYWNVIRGSAVVFSLLSLFLYIEVTKHRAETGVYRSCSPGISRCFYPYNSTKTYVLIAVITYVFQSLFVKLYFGIYVRKLKYEKILNEDNSAKYKTSFEKNCMNRFIPEILFDTDIYRIKNAVVYTIEEFSRFHGFIHIDCIGILRTKDLWIIYAARVLPLYIRGKFSISLMIWEVENQKVLIPKRFFWDKIFLSSPVKALREDLK